MLQEQLALTRLPSPYLRLLNLVGARVTTYMDMAISAFTTYIGTLDVRSAACLGSKPRDVRSKLKAPIVTFPS
jgi:hypothetical protein